MSDPAPAPFSFKAAKPARKSATEVVNNAVEATGESQLLPQMPVPEHTTRRKRGPNKAQSDDDLMVFLDLMNKLQTLTPVKRRRIVAALGKVFA